MEHVSDTPTSVEADPAVHHLQPSQAPREYGCFGQLAFGYRTSPATNMKEENVHRAGATEVLEKAGMKLYTQSNSNESAGNTEI